MVVTHAVPYEQTHCSSPGLLERGLQGVGQVSLVSGCCEGQMKKHRPLVVDPVFLADGKKVNR